jgi:preprotein translocase subunit SecE
VARGRQVPRRDCFGAPPAAAPSSPSKSGSRMINPFQFMQEVRSEADKITWPTRRETLITSGLVILMVVFASLFFVLVDSTLRFGVKLLLRAGQLG